MFCKNCGAEVNAGVQFCKKCGNPVNNSNNANSANNSNKQGGSANYPNNNYIPNMYDAQVGGHYSDDTPEYEGTMRMPEYGVSESAYDTTVYYKKRGIGKTGILSIVLGIIVALLIGVLVFIFLNYSDDGEIPFFGDGESSSNETSDEEEKEVELELVVEDTPSSVEEYEYTIRGTVSAEGCDAKLSINGEVIETFKDGSKDKDWEYSVALDYGDNEFEIVLYDPENKNETKETEKIEIENTAEKITYAEGTYLYKTCVEGLNIRKNHTKDSPVVFYIYPDDYYTPMICQGEEYFDGTYKWFKVKVDGNLGWVRENNVAPNH